MRAVDDPRLAEAKAMPMSAVVDRLGIAGLKPVSGELVGPCPMCGGRDRFAIKLSTGQFLCRKCDLSGGDAVALVMGVMGFEFRAALAWLCGDAPAQTDTAEIERRRAKAMAAQVEQDAISARKRAQARADAQSIWMRAKGQPIDAVVAYLRQRSIVLPACPGALRFLPDHPYVKMIGGQLVTAHRGPCMVAAIQSADGTFGAVHQTWLDPTAPKGKAVIRHGDDVLPAKLVRGSKKGGAIRLATPPDATVLVMGEGIETTASAMAAGAVPGAAYWAGVDLGNMAGRQLRLRASAGAHGRLSGWPDLDDGDAFVPPPWVRHLIFIQDGDSDYAVTRAKCLSGLRRAMALRPGLRAQIVFSGHGYDLNDLLMTRGINDVG